MRLSRDHAEYERIANDPAVLPFVAPHGIDRVDLKPFFENTDNVGFLYNDCGFLVHCLEPGVYEVHSIALPHVRGGYVFSAATMSIRFMFLATEAMELLTRVPHGNVAATALTRKVGFEHEFSRPNGWKTADGAADVEFYAMRYPSWVRHQDWLKASGEWFHSLTGISEDHEDDPAHDIYVGAMVETVLGGQPDKAAFLYNRWARFAGYGTVSIVDREPLTFLVDEHLVTVTDGKVEIARCQ